MKRRDYYAFMADVVRFRPFAIVMLATLVVIPSIFDMLTQGMSVIVVLFRYLVALVVMGSFVWIVSTILIRYATMQARAESESNKSGRNYL